MIVTPTDWRYLSHAACKASGLDLGRFAPAGEEDNPTDDNALPLKRDWAWCYWLVDRPSLILARWYLQSRSEPYQCVYDSSLNDADEERGFAILCNVEAGD